MATTPEAQELGALLRRLKERSGHSYGVLAGRLHVSTSTLHRYCNGDAVPAEFVAVERFARLCGAGREELIDLHRRWIVADDARTRGRSGTGTRPPEPEPVAASGPEPVPVVGSESGSGPVVGSASGPEPGAKAAPEPEAATRPDVPAGAAGAVGAVDSAEATESTEPAESAESTEPAETAGPAASPPLLRAESVPGPRADGPRRRRVLVALAAAAVVAVAVPVAVFATGGGGGRPDRAAPGSVPSGPATGAAALVRPGSSPSATPTATPTPTPSGSASGTPTGLPGTATPSAPASRPAPGRNPSPTAPPSGGAPATGVPLRVGISSYNWEHPCGQYYLLDGEPGRVPPPPPPQDHRSWARSLGAVDGGGMRLELTATGRTADSVVINDIHVRVVGRSAPLPWSAYSMGEGCGSGVVPQTFAVDLDRSRPDLRPVAGQDGDTIVPAKDFPYKVASDDPQVLRFDVTTEAHDVRWYLEVSWSSGDRKGVIRVDDGGRPFRTSATAGRPSYIWWADPGEWRPSEGN
ncbi:helix-turn-helix domain-containing protein [Streptomyces sp. NPDC001744]|uniref:helix-turn-helix domain-containing protein n=1 Tax=Streptomyces sp. NPDC001744 TaxID=3364606 RepID=UPI0036C3BB71